MNSFHFDTQSHYMLRWPQNDMATYQVGLAYVARENALPPAEQQSSPPLAQIEALVNEVRDGLQGAFQAEANRAIAGETFRANLVAVKEKLRRARDFLSLHHSTRLTELELWGFQVVQGKRGPRVKMPTRQSQWLWLLERYVAYETAQPVEQQLPDPVLAEMTALLAAAQSNAATRDQEKNGRTVNNNFRIEAAAELRQMLKLAAANLSVLVFAGKVTPELAQWGFDVVAVVSDSEDEPVVDGVAPETAVV